MRHGKSQWQSLDMPPQKPTQLPVVAGLQSPGHVCAVSLLAQTPSPHPAAQTKPQLITENAAELPTQFAWHWLKQP